MQGWDYAYSKDSAEWFSKPFATSFVRRRRWTHYIFGTHRKENDAPGVKTDLRDLSKKRLLTESATSEGVSGIGVEDDRLNRALEHFEDIERLSGQNAQLVSSQGEQILRTLKQAAMVSDTTKYAERINRAADVSGVLRNLVTTPTIKHVKSPKSVQRTKRMTQESDNAGTSQDSINRLDNSVVRNLALATDLRREIKTHNQQLEEVDTTIESATSRLKGLDFQQT